MNSWRGLSSVRAEDIAECVNLVAVPPTARVTDGL